MLNLTFRKTAWIVFVTALVIRLFFWVYIGSVDEQKFFSSDTKGYLGVAANLRGHAVFSREAEPPFIPDITLTPAYPLLLAGITAVFGKSLAVIALLQALVSALTAWLLVHLVEEWGGTPLQGLAAGLLFALEPVSILLANLVLTETLFMLEVAAAILLMVRYQKGQQIGVLAAAASMLGLAALTRPISQLLPLVWLPLLWMLAASRKSKLKNSFIFLAVFLLWVGPWLLRNAQVSGVMTLSNISHQNLVFYRARAVLVNAEGISEQQAVELLEVKPETARTQGLSYRQKLDVERQRAWGVLMQYPLATLEMTVKGAARLLLDPGYSAVCTLLDRTSLDYECFIGKGTMLSGSLVETALARLKTMTFLQQAFLVWGVLLTGVLYLGSVWAAWGWLKQHRWYNLVLFSGTALYYLVLACGAESNYRLRAPAIPVLAVMAGIALGAFFEKRRRYRTG